MNKKTIMKYMFFAALFLLPHLIARTIDYNKGFNPYYLFFNIPATVFHLTGNSLVIIANVLFALVVASVNFYIVKVLFYKYKKNMVKYLIRYFWVVILSLDVFAVFMGGGEHFVYLECLFWVFIPACLIYLLGFVVYDRYLKDWVGSCVVNEYLYPDTIRYPEVIKSVKVDCRRALHGFTMNKRPIIKYIYFTILLLLPLTLGFLPSKGVNPFELFLAIPTLFRYNMTSVGIVILCIFLMTINFFIASELYKIHRKKPIIDKSLGILFLFFVVFMFSAESNLAEALIIFIFPLWGFISFCPLYFLGILFYYRFVD